MAEFVRAYRLLEQLIQRLVYNNVPPVVFEQVEALEGAEFPQPYCRAGILSGLEDRPPAEFAAYLFDKAYYTIHHSPELSRESS